LRGLVEIRRCYTMFTDLQVKEILSPIL
jgi:hypothetical protein